MSDLLSPLLFVMKNEVDAFWCFVGFMDRVASNFEFDQVDNTIWISSHLSFSHFGFRQIDQMCHIPHWSAPPAVIIWETKLTHIFILKGGMKRQLEELCHILKYVDPVFYSYLDAKVNPCYETFIYVL